MKKIIRESILAGVLAVVCLMTGAVSYLSLKSRSTEVDEMQWELEKIRLRVKNLVAEEDGREDLEAPKWKISREGNMSEVLECIETGSKSAGVVVEQVLTKEHLELGRFDFTLKGQGPLAAIVNFLAELERYEYALVLQDLSIQADVDSRPTFKLELASYFGFKEKGSEEEKK